MIINLEVFKNTPKVSFIIPTNKERENTIRANIEKLAGKYADVIFVKNPDNISKAYDEAAKRAKYDIIVFMHDDVELRWPDDWYKQLQDTFKDPKIGFLGMAGTKGLLDSGVWFEGLQAGWATHLLGKVWHGWFDKNGTYKECPTVYGPYGQAVALDGVCLITTKKVLEKIEGFSKEIFGDFHFYDVSATLRATLAGLVNLVIPFSICHMSVGTFDDNWEEARKKFVAKYAEEYLPIVKDVVKCPANFGERKLKVFGFMPGTDGCSYYRVKQPIDKMVEKKLAMARYYNSSEVDKFEKECHEVVTHTDLFIVRNGLAGMMKKVILNYDTLHKKFIHDSDDYDFELSPYNPFYGMLGIEDFWAKDGETGEMLPIWIDQNHPDRKEIEKKYSKYAPRFYDKQANLKKTEDLKWMLSHADMVTVTTKELGDRYKEFNNNIVVIPNTIDFKVWRRLPFVKNDNEIRIVWMGGASHFEDLTILSKWLPKFLKKHKNCKFIVVGDANCAGWLKNIPKEQLGFYKWVCSEAHPYRMMTLNADIALIPLKGSKFDSGKSPLKVLEFGALGVPSLVSNVTPYKQVVKDGENGLLFATKDEFMNKLDLLVRDKERRMEIGDKIYEFTRENYDADKWAKKQIDIYEDLYFSY